MTIVMKLLNSWCLVPFKTIFSGLFVFVLIFSFDVAAQGDAITELTSFVPKDFNATELNDWEKGQNYSIVTSKSLEAGLGYSTRVKGMSLTDLSMLKIDGALLKAYSNVQALYVQAGSYDDFNTINERAAENLNIIAEEIKNFRNLKYVKVIGSNLALNEALSKSISLQHLTLYNSENASIGNGDWKGLKYIKFIGDTKDLSFSNMGELDSIYVGSINRLNCFKSIEANSIRKVTFFGDPSLLDFTVFNAETLESLQLDLAGESAEDVIQLTLKGLQGLNSLSIVSSNPIEWREVEMKDLSHFKLVLMDNITGDPYYSEFPHFIAQLQSLSQLELDVYSDYVPKSKDFGKSLREVKLRFRRSTDISSIRFLKKNKSLNRLELSLYPVSIVDSGNHSTVLSRDCWLARRDGLSLSLRSGIGLKHIEKILDKGNLDELAIGTKEAKNLMGQLCDADYLVTIYPSFVLNEENQIELVRLTAEELKRLNECLGENIRWSR